jgi:hypothetical protein
MKWPGTESGIKAAAVSPEEIVEEKGSLPELELIELLKSKKPINFDSIEKHKLKIESIRPWNNYTLVTLEGSDEIQIFDEEANKIAYLGKEKFSKTIFLSMQDLTTRRKIPTEKISSDSVQYGSSYTQISLIPFELRNILKKQMEKTGNFYLSLQEVKNQKIPTSGMTVIGRYIILHASTETFMAFDTENENKVSLAPRNWKRIDLSVPYPKDLAKYGEKR